MTYIHKAFEIKNIEELHGFIEEYDFATLIATNDKEIEISHIPVMLDRTKGQHGLLCWHLAKQNKQSLLFDGKSNALCIFHGPHAYISPSWYKTSPSVPTWNYAVVHVHGVPKKISQQQLSDDLDKFVSHYESKSNNPYHIPEDYKLKLMDHIVGFRMEITRIEGKFKLGQNRSLEDQNNMLNELLKQKDNQDAVELAKFIINKKTKNKKTLV